MYPDTAATIVIQVVTIKYSETSQHNSEENNEGMEGGWNADERKQSEEDRMETNQKKEIERGLDEEMQEVHVLTTDGGAPHHQSTPFDWATDVDKSISIIPVGSANPTNPTRPVVLTSSIMNTKPNPIPSNPLTSNAATISHANISANPSPIAGFNVVKTPINPVLFVDQTPVTSAWVPQDFSGLCLGLQNPWGTINHCRHRFNPPQKFSFVEQPWPLPDLHSRLHLWHRKPVLHDPLSLPQSYSHPQHVKLSQLDPHSQPCSPVQLQSPVHIFQIIQHLHGISPTKPKITKTIPNTTTKIPKNIHTSRCACGNIIPTHSPD